jgi:hypothetical protein
LSWVLLPAALSGSAGALPWHPISALLPVCLDVPHAPGAHSEPSGVRLPIHGHGDSMGTAMRYSRIEVVLHLEIRGWYNLAGGGAGFLLVETDDPRELTQFLQPYMDLIRWNVHAVYELPYEETIEAFRRQIQAVS